MVRFTRTAQPGRLETLETGSFFLPGDTATFELQIENLRFEFWLEQSSAIEGQRLEVMATDESSVRLKLVNFDNPLGTAWDSAVGTLNGADLHLGLIIHTINGNASSMPRTVTYSFYRQATI